MDLTFDKVLRAKHTDTTQSHSNHHAASSLLSMSAASVSRFEGANAKLLLGMMDCLDTSLLNAQQTENWAQLREKIRLAADRKSPFPPEDLKNGSNQQAFEFDNTDGSYHDGKHRSQSAASMDAHASSLHQEASVQAVLACLLEQKASGYRAGNSELKIRVSQDMDSRPTLKSLLSSNDFTQSEKKESLKHLLSFIDNSFSTTNNMVEHAGDVHRDRKGETLQRISSLNLMCSLLSPKPSMQSMGMQGRTTSFEIIHAMLNANSNQAIQKPMTSQDSFRFQHLANVLEAMEGQVANGYDTDMNEDYGNEEVVAVENLDNLLEYQTPQSQNCTNSQSTNSITESNHQHPTPGFIDTQSLINPSRSIYNELRTVSVSTNEYPPFTSSDSHTTTSSSMMYGNNSYSLNELRRNPPSLNSMMSSNSDSNQSATFDHHATSSDEYMTHGYSQHLHTQSTPPSNAPPSGFSNISFTQPSFSDPLIHSMPPFKYSNSQPSYIMQQTSQNYSIPRIFNGPNQGNMTGLPTPARIKQQKQEALGQPLCSALGCNHLARIKGMCKLHGGGRRCKVEGCMKSAQTGHLCIAHGGGKPCSIDGCPKTAQSRGLCKQHGGGVRCKFEGCTKSCQSGGFCRGHGGGKRCEYPHCTKWAQKNGHCAKHAQELAQKMGLR
uniref:Uncharacterized protein AlNc14C37G3257 n=1 Tax=Albugo laibachii Nc14 TaxID=890382 RepID=F0W8Y2_9STRA|nr:conserved hypothetical protein [Albugo laibachii Nc14]|eukprot:CCA17593.1 conserved hypothetical protein [Albugo laibachii Nc14]